MKKYNHKLTICRLGAAVVSVSLLSALASCGPPADAHIAKLGKVMVIGRANTDDNVNAVSFWNDVKNGATDAAKELQYTVDFRFAENDDDYKSQQDYLDEAIKANYDVIVISPNSRDELVSRLNDAKEKGIKLISIDSPSFYKGFSCSIGSSDNTAASIAATEAANALKAESGRISGIGKVGIIAHTAPTAEVRIGAFKTAFSLLALNDIKNPPSATQQAAANAEKEEELIDPSEAARLAAEAAKAKGEDPDKAAKKAAQEAAKKLEEAAAKSTYANSEAQVNTPSEEEQISDIQRLADINKSYYIESKRCLTATDAYDLAYRMLSDESNNIKVMYGTNTNTTIGICMAVEKLGLKDDVIVVGFNSSEKIISYIKSGVLDATVVQNPYNIGYFSICYARSLVNDEKVPVSLDTGITVVNKNNVDDDLIQLILYPHKKIEIQVPTKPEDTDDNKDGSDAAPQESNTNGGKE